MTLLHPFFLSRMLKSKPPYSLFSSYPMPILIVLDLKHSKNLRRRALYLPCYRLSGERGRKLNKISQDLVKSHSFDCEHNKLWTKPIIFHIVTWNYKESISCPELQKMCFRKEWEEK